MPPTSLRPHAGPEGTPSGLTALPPALPGANRQASPPGRGRSKEPRCAWGGRVPVDTGVAMLWASPTLMLLAAQARPPASWARPEGQAAEWAWAQAVPAVQPGRPHGRRWSQQGHCRAPTPDPNRHERESCRPEPADQRTLRECPTRAARLSCGLPVLGHRATDPPEHQRNACHRSSL